jgi:hypothetical protein
MRFTRYALRDDFVEISLGDSASRHDDDSVLRFLHEIGDEVQALKHRVLLTGGQPSRMRRLGEWLVMFALALSVEEKEPTAGSLRVKYSCLRS